MKDNIKIRGMVTVRVLDRNGNVKRRNPRWFGRLLKLPGRLMEFMRHNIVTREGDALIADALMPTQAKTKVNGTNGYIQVGTGWTGSYTKTNTKCNSSTGSPKQLDGGYPALKEAWGSSGDTESKILYKGLMGKIYRGQSALRITLKTFSDLRDVSLAVIKFRKPNGKTGEFAAVVGDPAKGFIFHECIEGDIDISGWWAFWAFVTFVDGRSAAGEAAKVYVWEEGK